MRRLLLPALLIYCVILFRAGHQAATLDEADAFNNFATGNLDMSFYPSSGNHVLNSLLARYSTRLFGISQFTFRIPAMLGALLYLLASAAIATHIATRRQYLAFAILTLSPFMLDYLVAARGYALALGFLACAVALALRVIDAEPHAVRDSALLSVCCALAVAANFSFAFSIISLLAAYLLTLLLLKMRPGRWLAIATASTLPGLVAGFALVGDTLRHFPRDQLYFGAETWFEMWNEMLSAVFPRQNLSVTAVNLEPVLTAAHAVAAFMIVIPIGIGFWTALHTDAWPIRFVCLALGFTLLAHGLAHRLQGLLLPMDRTSIFIAFFLSLVAVYGASEASNAYTRQTATAVLCGTLVIFALAFRTNYFRIWDFDLDIDRGYAALAAYAKDHKLDSAGCTWRYGGAYNFYHLEAPTILPLCTFIDQDKPPPLGAYFMHVPGQAEFIAKARLKIIYQGALSGLVVGITPLNENGSH